MKRLLWATLSLVMTAAGQPKGEFVYETAAPIPFAASPTLVEAKGGEILAAWFGGVDSIVPNRAPGDRLAIWMSRLSKGVWSAPKEVAREPNTDCGNPVLFRTKDGAIQLYYKIGGGVSNWTAVSISSTDEGRTWSERRYLPSGLFGPAKNKPLILDDGTIVAGTSSETYRAWACWVERSTDNGRTWTKHGPIVHPKYPQGIIQPTIVPISGNRLRMFVRSKHVARICYSDSADRGKTWTEAKETTLPNPDSGIDAVALKDGRIVLAYNHSPRDKEKDCRPDGPCQRWPLNLAVSEDGGDTWNSFIELESKPGVYGYPSIIQASDGKVHVVYFYNTGSGPMWKPSPTAKPTQRLSGGPLIKHVEVPLRDIPWKKGSR